MLFRVVILVIAVVMVVYGGLKCPVDEPCSPWDYLGTCGGPDCRSNKWRICPRINDVPCDEEDDTFPCWHTEWSEWSECSKDDCKRIRKEVCKCKNEIVDNDQVCKANLRTENETCLLVPVIPGWGDCDESCQKRRTPKCMCGRAGEFTDGMPQPFLVSPLICGLEAEEEIADCDRNCEWSPWDECDSDCEKRQECTCTCENGYTLDDEFCGLTPADTVNITDCGREWSPWEEEECPADGESCVEFVDKSRHCTCVTDNPFKIEDHECGLGATMGMHVCDYGCRCEVEFHPPECLPSCQAPNIAVGDNPKCNCDPDGTTPWHNGTCDPYLMSIREEMACPVQPSEWQEWSEFSPCDPITCNKTRTRICSCCPAPGEWIETNLCEGSAVDNQTCSTTWTPWENFGCPVTQTEGQCSLSSKRFRECQCEENKSPLSPDKCDGDNKDDYPCPVPEPCQCEWTPVLTTNPCPVEPSCVEKIEYGNWECKCTPEWYSGSKWGGECTEPKPERPSSVCEPTVEYEWSQWGPWGGCDTDCKKSRSRSCSCLGDVDNGACGYGKIEEVKDCETEWTPWEGGCPLCCEDKEIEQTRSCQCKENSSAKNLVGKCPGSGSKTLYCPRKEYELSSWQPWAPRDVNMACMCMTEREKVCQCFADDPRCEPYVTNVALCEGERVQQKLVDLEWTGWSEPECGELECGYKVRPSYRYCECDMTVTEWPDMIGRVENENCPYTRNERGMRCPQLDPGDDKCQTTPEPFHKGDRTAYEEAKAAAAAAAAGEEVEEEEKEEDEEGTDEGTLPDIPLPDLIDLSAGLGECVCDAWINTSECSSTCTQDLWRSCVPEGCDDEHTVVGGCCEDCDPGSQFDGESCVLCPANTFKADQGPQGCTSCPENFFSEEGSAAESDCEDPCAGCGPWVDVGACPPEAGPGSYFWRSSGDGCHSDCLTFECIPLGDGFDPCSTCGQWLDVGSCPDDEPGQYQWRSVDVCDCEEHRCVN